MRRDIEYNSHKYMSNTPGGVQVLPPNDLILIERPLLFLFLRWMDVVCLCVHGVLQNTKHPFLIHANTITRVY
jgi:hypothetical protein